MGKERSTGWAHQHCNCGLRMFKVKMVESNRAICDNMGMQSYFIRIGGGLNVIR